MNAAGLSTEDLERMKNQTMLAIKAKFGDQPLFVMLDSIEQLLSENRVKSGLSNGHAPRLAVVPSVRKGKPSPDEIANLAYSYMEAQPDLEASEIAVALRDSAGLGKDDRKATAVIAAILRRRPERFFRVEPATSRERTKWRIVR